MTTDLAGLAPRIQLSPSTHPPTTHPHTHTHVAPSLQVNGFDSFPLHLSLRLPLSLSPCPSQIFALSVLISLCLLHPHISPCTLFFCAFLFHFFIPFLHYLSISSLPYFSFLSLSLPFSLSLSYLECVLHMYEGCDKVLPSAQTQPSIQRAKSVRCGEKDGEKNGESSEWGEERDRRRNEEIGRMEGKKEVKRRNTGGKCNAASCYLLN